MSAATPLNNETDECPASEPSRPTEPRPWPKPASPMREALNTLELEEEEDFDFHDTIPAPPWLDDAAEAELPAPLAR